jgi:hypothetical protein
MKKFLTDIPVALIFFNRPIGAFFDHQKNV